MIHLYTHSTTPLLVSSKKMLLRRVPRHRYPSAIGRFRSSLFVIICFVLFFIFRLPAFAADRVWTNGSSDGKWSTAANWSPASVPGSADRALFNGTSSANCTIDINPTIQNITTTVDYGGTIFQGSSTITVSVRFDIAGAEDFDAGTGLTIFKGSVTLVSSASVNNAEIDGNIVIGADLKILNDLTITNLGTMIYNTLTSTGNSLLVEGDLIVNDPDGWRDTGTNNTRLANLNLVGSGDQIIRSNTGSKSVLTQLAIDKPTGNILLANDMEVSRRLNGSASAHIQSASNAKAKLVLGGTTLAYQGDVENVELVGNGNITLNGDLKILHELTLTAVNAIVYNTLVSGGTILVEGNVISDDTNGWGITGTNNTSRATLSLTGSNDQTLSGTGKIPLLRIAKPAGKVLMPSSSVANGFERVTISSGVWDVSGFSVTSSGGFISNGGKIIGPGTLNGAVTCNSGSGISPGNGAGCLTINGNLSMRSGSTLTVDIADGEACTNHDQLVVNGTANINGAMLVGGMVSRLAAPIKILENDGTDATSGTFASALNNATITLGGTQYIIKYNAGSNDITLEDPNPNVAPTAVCKPVTVAANGPNCTATVNAQDFNDGSSDPEGGSLTYSVLPAGPYAVGTTSVTLTVTDPLGATASCQTTVTVQNATEAPSVDDTQNTFTYNGNPQTASATASNGATVQYFLAPTGGEPVNPVATDAGTYTFYAQASLNGCVSTSRTEVTLKISQAKLTIVVDDKTKDYGQDNPTLTGTVTGIVPSDGIIVNYSTTANNNSEESEGGYPISATLTDPNNRLGNYTVSNTPGVLTVVGKANQPPVAAAKDIVVTLDATGKATITPDDIDGGSTDDQGITNKAISNTSFGCNPANYALAFNGTNPGGYFTLPAGVVKGLTNFTFEAWVNYTDNGNWTRFMDFGNSTTVNMFFTAKSDRTPNAGRPRFAITNGGIGGEQLVTSSIAMPTGWHHVAVVLKQVSSNSVVGTMYIDGNVVGANNAMTLTPNSLNGGITNNNFIGKSQYPDPYLKGQMDEVRIWSVARTAAEINTFKDKSLSGNEFGLFAYYDFEDGPGSTKVKDKSPSKNDGTLFNMTSYQPFVAPGVIQQLGVGENNVTLTVSDAAGLSSSAVAKVTVVDNMAPTLTAVNKTIPLVAGSATLKVEDVVTAYSDNCGVASLQLSKSSFDCSNLGDNIITVTATDVNGKVTSVQVTVTVTDPQSSCNKAPVAVAKPLVVSADANCQGTATAEAFNDGSSDPDGDKLTFSVSPAGPYTKGTTNVVFTVTDSRGATSSVNTSITVEDKQGPTFTAPADRTVSLLEGCSFTVPDLLAGLTGRDNCGTASFTQNPAAGTVLSSVPNQTHKVMITATDEAGNDTEEVVTLTAKDEKEPLALARPLTIQLDASGKATITPAQLNNGSSDNCTDAASLQMSLSKTSFDCSDVGENTVILTITDASGNSATAEAVVNVEDKIQPDITCPDEEISFCFAASNTYTIPALAATDNCQIASVSFTISGATNRTGTGTDASGEYQVGISTIQWTVTDQSGNFSQCSRTVVINAPLSVSLASVNPIGTGAQPNTIYIGYGPQSLIYEPVVSGGTAPYSYTWSNGSTGSSLVVTAAGDYSVSITDARGCVQSTSVVSVQMVDVRCGNKNDKVLVCHKTNSAKNPWNQICIDASAVAAHLEKGSKLGTCASNPGARTSGEDMGSTNPEVTELTVVVGPNPTRDMLSVDIKLPQPVEVLLEVRDLRGVLFQSRQLAPQGNSLNEKVSLADYPEGVYLLNVQTATERKVIKVMRIQ